MKDKLIEMRIQVKTIALIFGISWMTIACSTTQKITEDNTTKGDNTTVITSDVSNKEDEKDVSSQETGKEDSLFARIERGFCFGKCPVYKMEIFKSGYAVYHGINFTEMEGVYSTQITPEEMDELLKKAESIEFGKMKDEYDGPITDLPSVTTAIVLDGTLKEVRRRYDYPRSILSFEEIFDAIINTHEWTKIGEVER